MVEVVAVVLLLSLSAPIRSVGSQPSSGNWIVTGRQVVQNESITLNGNLTIQSGGNLTLQKVTLTVNGQSPGQYSIYVAPGGSLYIYNSTITAANLQDGYSFVVMGSHFVLKDSEVHGVGWCLTSMNVCSNDAGQGYWYGSTTYPYGLRVITNDAVVQDDLISTNVGGIWLSGANETVANNRLVSDPLLPILMQNVSNSTILSNTVNDTTPFPNPAVLAEGSNGNSFHNNTISCPQQLVGGDEVSCFGLELGGSWRNVISDNHITAATTVWLQEGSSDNVVAGNHLVAYGSGFYVLASVSNRILNNSIQVNPQQSGGDGMFLTSAHNSTIAGNTIFGGQGTGIFMDGTSGSRILNNNFSTPTYLSISLFGSQNNIISGNRITNTEIGLQLYYLSNGNTISDNQIKANATLFNDCCGHGIYVKDSSGNSIYHNNFIGGELGPYDNGNNTWYSEDSGNYWSMYSGTGAYSIPPNGTDPYPLSRPIVVEPVSVVYAPSAPYPQAAQVPSLPEFNLTDTSMSFGAANVVVSHTMAVKNSVVRFGTNGSFTVTLGSGSQLLIRNSTVYWEQGYLWVGTGSRLTIEDSKIIGGQKQQFHIGEAGALVMENSSIESTPTGFGWVIENRESAPNSSALINGTNFYSYGTLSEDVDGPVILFDIARISIHNSYFAGCQDGLVGGDYNGAKGEIVTFTNNTFFDVGIPIMYTDTDLYQPNYHYNSTLYIEDNTFSGGTVIGGNITLTDNSLSGGIGLYGNDVHVTANNFYSTGIVVQGQSVSVSGNYWSDYKGNDSNLDGIGDTPYTNNGITDDMPYMRPNGWLTKFYLTVETNLPTPSSFQINGSTFNTGPKGVGTFRLGYVAEYKFVFPETITLSNGTVMTFSHWADGVASPSRVLPLSSNSTLLVFYQNLPQQQTTSSTTSKTTNTVSTSTMRSSTTSTTSTSVIPISTTTSVIQTTGKTTPTTSSSISSISITTTPLPGGVPNYVFYFASAVAVVVVVTVAIFALRRRR